MAAHESRYYQREAIDAVFDFWANGGENPLVDLATGTGKSYVIADLMRRLCEYPDMRLLLLVHVQELVQQNFHELIRLWPDAPAGVYSAGLGRRDLHHRITFASIQSVYRKARELGARHCVMIDEAHLVPHDGDGMYRKLLDGLKSTVPDLRVVGFTATPYRLGSGRLDNGDGRIFSETVYSYGIGQGIRDGYLSPIISPGSLPEIDVSNVARRGGEFVAGALEAAADGDKITQAACDEILKYGELRRSWLVFCSGIKHAFHVRDAMRARGISCETITGETPNGERAAIINAYKDGSIRCLTNASVLTTGFNAPATDLVAFLRPTLSTGLYVQMVGRATRRAPGKDNALILDFAGNVRRHGPVDAIEIKPKRNKMDREDGEENGKAKITDVKAKECPGCQNLVHIAVKRCPHCDHEFPVKTEPNHEARAESSVPILSTERLKPEEIGVLSWEFNRHEKEDKPPTMRVSYMAGFKTYNEWICFEHPGFAGEKARRWWARMGGAYPTPKTVAEAMARTAELTRPYSISIRMNGKWPEIVGYRSQAVQTGRVA